MTLSVVDESVEANSVEWLRWATKPSTSSLSESPSEEPNVRAPYWSFKSLVRFLDRVANGVSEQFTITELRTLNVGKRLALLRALKFFGLIQMNGHDLGSLRFTDQTRDLCGASREDLVQWSAGAIERCYPELWALATVENEVSSEDWLNAIHRVYGYTGSMATRTLQFFKKMVQYAELEVNSSTFDAFDSLWDDVETQAVRAYLEILVNPNLRPSAVHLSAEAIAKKLDNINERIRDRNITNTLTKLNCLQERRTLQTQLETAIQQMCLSELEADFVTHAASFSQHKGIQYATWREFGVPANILRRAGIGRSNRLLRSERSSVIKAGQRRTWVRGSQNQCCLMAVPEASVCVDPTNVCEMRAGLGDVTVLEVTVTGRGELRVTVETRLPRPVCSGCGGAVRVKDRNDTEYADLTFRGRSTVLVWRKIRWRCASGCGAGSFTETCETIAALPHRLTDRAGRWAAVQVTLRGRSVNDVAHQIGASWEAVKAAVVAYGEVLDDDSDC